MGKTQESEEDRRQFWQMAIETWQASGLSIRQFCKQEGLSELNFYTWRKKLSGNRSKQAKQDDSKPPSAFVEVSLPQNSPALELLFSSGNTLRISSGADRKTLSDVISILHSAGLC